MTVEDAKANATQGLKDLLASTGMKPRGKVSSTCSTTLIVSDCSARQTGMQVGKYGSETARRRVVPGAD
jgi:hypothetical protein